MNHNHPPALEYLFNGVPMLEGKIWNNN